MRMKVTTLLSEEECDNIRFYIYINQLTRATCRFISLSFGAKVFPNKIVVSSLTISPPTE